MTSGAVETVCDEPPPADVNAAILARPAQRAPVPYREKIFHPAMDDPLIARGSFDLGPDGTLIRSQSFPEVEVTRIDTHMITIERPDQSYRNVVPVPSEMIPILKQLRRVAGADTAAQELPPEAELVLDEAGWRVDLQSPTWARLTLLGCGEVLTGLQYDQKGGSRREIVFGAR